MIAVALVALALAASPAAPPTVVPPSPEPISVPGPDAVEGAPAPPAFYSAAKEARALLDAGDPAGAAAKYEQALAERPTSAEAAYNLGVALHRCDKFTEASAAFARAAALASQGDATNPRLAADSLYNRAAGFYNSTREQAEAAQKAIKLRQQQKPDQPRSESPPVDTEALKQAIKDAQTSLQGFKDAAIANPADRDARANAEQSSRLIRALKELQRMQEEQQNQQQKKDQQQKQDQQDQEQKDQQEQEQKNNEQQSKDSKSSDQQESKDQPPPDSDQGKEGDKDQKKNDEEKKKDQGEQKDKEGEESKDSEAPEPKDPKEEEKKKDQQGQDKKDEKEQEPREAKGSETQQMTKDEANRLLQAVRDAEKKRRAQMEQRNAQTQTKSGLPAKDW